MYDGPIIDAHFHLYRYDPAAYPWLAGETDALRVDHLPDRFGALLDAAGVTSSVHIEAGRIADECLDETRWLDELDRPGNVANRLVVHVPLAREGADRTMELQAIVDCVVGVRDIVAWHPDPAKSRGVERPTEDPVWRRHFGLLAGHGLSFDVLMTPWQAEEIRRLADDHPDTQLAINHCGSPLDRDAEGMARWRDGLKLLAGAPNVAIKVSNPAFYDRQWTAESLSDVIRTCVDTFGPDRAMFASDDPVSGPFIGYGAYVDVFKGAVADLSPTEQRAVFHDTAARVYRLG